MSRWIDADAFKRCLQNYRPYVDSGRFNAIQTEANQLLDCIEYEIEDAPSIDIVRCGECMHNGSYDTDCPFGWRNGEWNLPKPCDFCSYGEREGE